MKLIRIKPPCSLAVGLLILGIGLCMAGLILVALLGEWEAANDIGRMYGNTRDITPDYSAALMLAFVILCGYLFASVVKNLRNLKKKKEEK